MPFCLRELFIYGPAIGCVRQWTMKAASIGPLNERSTGECFCLLWSIARHLCVPVCVCGHAAKQYIDNSNSNAERHPGTSVCVTNGMAVCSCKSDNIQTQNVMLYVFQYISLFGYGFSLVALFH